MTSTVLVWLTVALGVFCDLPQGNKEEITSGYGKVSKNTYYCNVHMPFIVKILAYNIYCIVFNLDVV